VRTGSGQEPENGYQPETVAGQYQPTRRRPPGLIVASGFARIWYGVSHLGETPHDRGDDDKRATSAPGILTMRTRKKTDSEWTFLRLVRPIETSISTK
jgi:hypothetical protein